MIGYFQHGEELRLNTRALHLQQEELHRQVEETAQLVKAADRQAQAAQQDLQHRQEREDREAAPEFVSDGASFSFGKVMVDLKNRGGEARNVSLHYDGPYEFNFPPKTYVESNGPPARLAFMPRRNQPPDYPIRFSINSTDRLGHGHNQNFELSQDLQLVRVIAPGRSRPS